MKSTPPQEILAPRALLITGPVGIGKTAVAGAVGAALAEIGVPGAVIDLDGLASAWPAPPDDRFNLALELRNLRAVTRNYLDAGAARLVLAGVVESTEDRLRYREALGVELAVCRLRAAPETIRRRLVGRHIDGNHVNDEAALRWHLSRATELERILDDARVADFDVSAESSVAEVARAVLAAAL